MLPGEIIMLQDRWTKNPVSTPNLSLSPKFILRLYSGHASFGYTFQHIIQRGSSRLIG